MRLALHTDYALRTLIYLATRPGRVTVAEVAEFHRVSVHHIGKVVNELGRLGVVRNHRGPGGGMELARPASDISVGEIILAFESTTVLLECLVREDVCVIQPGCRLRGVLAEAERRMMSYLKSISLEQLIPTDGVLVTFGAPALS
jgi:Rrf2 family nitric oxide-sensitive transcriptional repressor